MLTYPVKKPGGGRSSRQSVHLLTENAVARSLRRGPHSRGEHLRHHQAQKTRDSSHLPSSPVADVELGCVGETFNGHEDHKAFRREEFEGKLRDMGLELEKDEEVSFLTSLSINSFLKTIPHENCLKRVSVIYFTDMFSTDTCP